MIKILQVGLGPIGLQITRYIASRQGIKIVAGVDTDPRKAGKTINDICDFEAPPVKVYESLDEAVEQTEPNIAILTTVSKLENIEPQIATIAEQKLNIVSTCEELTYPWHAQPAIAGRIDEQCKKHGVSCLATGVNPGFLMDYLPVVLTSVCQQVEHIYVARIQDATHRRGPFQQKVGVGLSREEFEQNKTSISHVGLPESVGMIAAAMGWPLDGVDESLNPVIAAEPISSEGIKIQKEKNRGVEQVAIGYTNGKEVIKLKFRAAIGELEPRDIVEIKGQPAFKSTIEGGVNGDIATAAITINAIRSIQKMEPGLKTMLDISVPSFSR